VRDPLYHDDDAARRLAADRRVTALLARLQWLKLVSGALALALIAAIWLVWRYAGPG
jgi:hypothetical protein